LNETSNENMNLELNSRKRAKGDPRWTTRLSEIYSFALGSFWVGRDGNLAVGMKLEKEVVGKKK
jgi:hypothetical protein